MIPIVTCPKRFPTASKRPLRLLSSWAKRDARAAIALAPRPLGPPLPPPPLWLQQRQKGIAFEVFRPTSSARSFSSSLQREDDDAWDAAEAAPAVALSGEALLGPRPKEWWTGNVPAYGECPGVREDGTITSLPQLRLQHCSRQAFRDYFSNTWAITEVLFSSLQGEAAFTAPPFHALRHPLIFYYGHPAALYVNKLRVAGLIKEPVNAYFETIFETGVDEMSWDDLSKNSMDWPTVAEVHAYRKVVYDKVMRVIDEAPADALRNITADSPYWALPMSFEHERIHIETSSVLMRELPLHFLTTPREWPSLHPSVPERPNYEPRAGVDFPASNPMIPVEGGRVVLGKPKEFPSFGWDNEYGSRAFDVRPFEASRSKVTNGEFLAFVKDAGYARPELWSEEGWGWRAFRNSKAPPFWKPKGPSGLHHYQLRTVFREVAMPWDWPVEVNLHEAEAFARWKSLTTASSSAAGAASTESTQAQQQQQQTQQQQPQQNQDFRLLTELEHHLLRDEQHTNTGSSNVNALPAGAEDPVLVSAAGRMAADFGANSNLTYGGPSPVLALRPTRKGFHDVFGNVWEWCVDHFSALPGFAINPLYEDFSTPCFDGHHNVIMGGSYASTGNEASVFARFHFRPHFHQHAGFRIVRPSAAETAAARTASGAAAAGSSSGPSGPLTSCTDAPPPFVGTSYPFRSSNANAAAGHAADALRALSTSLATHYAAFGSGNSYYGNAEMALPGGVAAALRFPKRVAELANKVLVTDALQGVARVLDVGCGPGAAAFELARVAGKVMAVDADKAAIDWAKALQSNGSAEILLPRGSGGGSSGSVQRQLAPLQQAVRLDASIDASRVSFRQADPMCLPAEFAGFDAVVVHSVLDKLPSPAGLLGRMGGPRGMVKPGGFLLVASGFDWNASVTPEGAWLSGYVDAASGKEVDGEEGVKRALGPDFELVKSVELPAAVPLSDRKLSLLLASVTLWRRRS